METIDIETLKQHIDELSALYTAKQDAALTYAAGLDAVAEKSGVERRVLGKLVQALNKDKAEEAKTEAQELADLLETLA